jgi:hypothetical protein
VSPQLQSHHPRWVIFFGGPCFGSNMSALFTVVLKFQGLTRLQTAPRCPVSELGKSYAEFLVRCQIAFCQLKFAADAPGIPRVSHLAGQDPHAEKSDAIAPPPNHPHEN